MEDFTLTGLTAEEVLRRLSLMDVDKTPMTMELFWENPSPASEFLPQTIGFNGDYDRVKVDFRLNSSTATIVTVDVLTNDVGSQGSAIYGTAASFYGGYRSFIAHKTGVEFAGAYKVEAASGGKETRMDSYIIPQRIYGIKGV